MKSIVTEHSVQDSVEMQGDAKANHEDRARRNSVAAEQKGERTATADGPATFANVPLTADAARAKATAYDRQATSKASVLAEGPASGPHRVTRRIYQAMLEDNSLLPRMEKLRQASVGMLDEAADDPSLRFVLVAVALFGCFLLIFFASMVFN